MVDPESKLAEAVPQGLGDADLNRRDEMLREYYCVQDIIDRINERCLKVKSWSITSCGVAIGFGFEQNSPILFCLAAFGSLAFWYLEGLWKARERVAIERAHALEQMLAAKAHSYDGPKIAEIFRTRLRVLSHAKPFMEILSYRNVRLPHFFIFCIGILLFLASLLTDKLKGFFAL
jgi:hypothetical protein